MIIINNNMLRFNFLRLARPKQKARSWKSSSTATHFTYVSARDINKGKTAEGVAKEKQQQAQQQQQKDWSWSSRYKDTRDKKHKAGYLCISKSPYELTKDVAHKLHEAKISSFSTPPPPPTPHARTHTQTNTQEYLLRCCVVHQKFAFSTNARSII